MSNIHASRLAEIRTLMAARGIDAVIISGTDPHSSEYPAPRWKQVEWVSGFTGEAGDVVITLAHAGLWTDSRYFIQAEAQLKETGFVLHKTRIPGEVPIPEWLAQTFDGGLTVAFDGLCQSIGAVSDLKHKLLAAFGEGNVQLLDTPDFLSQLWADRPGVPATPVTFLTQQMTGSSRAEKVGWLRRIIEERGCKYMLLSSLDEIAWLLDVRGEDIDYNPYVISYLLVAQDYVCWFTRDVDNVPVVDDIANADYESLMSGICDAASRGGNILIDPATLNYHVYNLLLKEFGSARIVTGRSPVILKKAVKNNTEIEGFRKAFFEDGIAMEKFLHWIQTSVKAGEEISEWDASVKLTSLRAQIDGYHGNSFENISAYGKNAALPHYSTPVEGSSIIEKKGLYLVDSGGQYDFGTTDITRTVPMGRCTKKQKEDYTLVLKGMIDLSMAVFPKGTAGCQIDALAREPLWKSHRNFGHGTGHGIGFYLGVHEGPQSIRQNFLQQPLLPGMVTSNEPGLYREGKHGIRHENVILCCEDSKDEFAEWLHFETLTLCHIDTKPIIKKLLSKEELKWINSYNKKVYKTLSPYLEKDVAAWLKKKCRKIHRCFF